MHNLMHLTLGIILPASVAPILHCDTDMFGFLCYGRYQELMKESSRLPLFDLRKLNASLPVPSVPKSSIQVLVVGAKDDFIVVQSSSQYIFSEVD